MTTIYSYPSLLIKGKPMATPRPRAVRQGNHARVYNPTEYTQYLEQAANQMRAQWQEYKLEPIGGYIDCFISFVFPRPKSKMRKSSAKGRIPMPIKPDIDNLAKAALDACQRAEIIKDDKTIFRLTVTKHYGTFDGVDMCEDPHTLICFSSTKKRTPVK